MKNLNESILNQIWNESSEIKPAEHSWIIAFDGWVAQGAARRITSKVNYCEQNGLYFMFHFRSDVLLSYLQ